MTHLITEFHSMDPLISYPRLTKLQNWSCSTDQSMCASSSVSSTVDDALTTAQMDFHEKKNDALQVLSLHDIYITSKPILPPLKI